MQLHVVQHVPGDVDEVIAVLLDPTFLDELGELPKIDRPSLLSDERDGDVVVRRVRYRFTGDLSGAVTAVIDPAKLTWVEEARFDLRARTATFQIVPDHYGGRLRCSGTQRFTPGTDRVIDGEVKVSYPIVGRTVERAVLSGLEDHLAAEGELLRARVSTR